MPGNYRVAAQLVASRVVLSFTELVEFPFEICYPTIIRNRTPLMVLKELWLLYKVGHIRSSCHDVDVSGEKQTP
jgi:hypothetical protein